ncbi:MAG: sigma-54-dependent Fis family transcriptional regulator [Bdellovibrionales bacterium]|nr:sigma 54-interacting transcriptional regulator [Bdellovibrionales bacterium]NQZ17910.1 sigma-54-dependent Fis family transcriptional regulator [Bdellovibrionales bacterium]
MKEQDHKFDEKIKILLIDDDEVIRLLNEAEIKKIFGFHRQDLLVFTHASGKREAVEKSERESFHLIVLDHDLGSPNGFQKEYGLSCIGPINQSQSDAKILILTTYDDDPLLAEEYRSHDKVIGFLTKGESERAVDYRRRMFRRTLDEIHLNISREKKKLSNNTVLKLHKYKSPKMKQIYKIAEKISRVSPPILILGEPGSGKSHLAEEISELMRLHHKQKERKFLEKNIGAIPENLIEVELFGAEPGAYTDAKKRKIGMIESVGDGTCFLDEIGEASEAVQVKLLKVVEDNTIMRVGGVEKIKVNSRFIFATNRNLRKLIEERKFRQDLYDRISFLTIEMPSLKDRKEDIPVLCEDICEDIRKNEKIEIFYDELPNDLKDYLSRGEIEGNIRGLYGSLLKISIFCKKEKGGFDFSKWRSVLNVDINKIKDTSISESSSESYEELIIKISNLIVEKDNFQMNEVKEDIEYKTLERIKELKDGAKLKCTEVGKMIGLSKSNAHSKIKKFEKIFSSKKRENS